jgi:hypothetical protein
MNPIVRASRQAKAAVFAARAAAFGVLASAFLAGPVMAQGAPAQLGEPNRQIILAQQSQRAPAQAASRIKETAGRYAVLREEGKDTLCMVTLFDTARGRGYYRAQLAPACRDNGIVIFDPVAWSIDNKGNISLQARKGHKMILARDANDVWQRTGEPKARPLALRRI